MNTTSITSLVVGSVVLVIFFLLFGGEVIAGIILISWMLLTRKAQSGRWVSAKTQSVASRISRFRAKRISRSDVPQRSIQRNYQTERRLTR
jgi:hypothetical protein